MSSDASSLSTEPDGKSTEQNAGQFHISLGDSGICTCPIHNHNHRGPFTAPLGYRFANDVHIECISASQAEDIYAKHHSYMDSLPSVNLVHHGIFYNGNIVGAITYRFGLGGKRAVRWDESGEFLARPHGDGDFDELPDKLETTARRIIPEVDPVEVARREVLSGDKFLEAARICIGVEMPNLASCALARSQDRIVRDYCEENSVEFLYTFVRADFDGAMIRALKDKGWTCTGWSEPSEASNRENKPIREKYKWRFVAPVEQIKRQSELSDFIGV